MKYYHGGEYEQMKYKKRVHLRFGLGQAIQGYLPRAVLYRDICFNKAAILLWEN